MINAFLSVVLVNKNDQANLLSTIDSLFHQIEKISSQFELVVIDNCSSDGSIKILEELSENNNYKLPVFKLIKIASK